jgi:hypothetical protein
MRTRLVSFVSLIALGTTAPACGGTDAGEDGGVTSATTTASTGTGETGAGDGDASTSTQGDGTSGDGDGTTGDGDGASGDGDGTCELVSPHEGACAPDQGLPPRSGRIFDGPSLRLPPRSGPGDGDGDGTTTGIFVGDGDGDGTTGSFVAFVGDGDGDCGTECDPWAQDCPAGEKCTAVACDVGSTAWDTNVCVPVMGSAAEGDTCQFLGGGLDGLDDCGPGLMCWGADENFQGTCVSFCQCDPTDPKCGVGAEGMCSVSNQGVLPLCLPMCDPLGDACAGANVCIPALGSDDGFICVLDASGGQGTAGTPCSFANSCNPGLLCADGAVVPGCAGGACCTEYCDLNNPNCSVPGTTCAPYYTGTAPECHDDVGVCVS